MRLSATSISVTSKSVAAAGGGSNYSATFSMRYHMRGADMGSLYVFVQEGSNFTQILLKSGQQHANIDTEWTELTYDLMPSFAGKNIKIWMIAKHPGNNDYKSDIAVDAMSIVTNPNDGSGSTTAGYNVLNDDNRRKWRQLGEYTSLSAAKDTTNNGSNPDYGNINREWCVDQGGFTPSDYTGPDMSYYNSSSSDYLYYEGSGTTISTDRYYPIKFYNWFTVPS